MDCRKNFCVGIWWPVSANTKKIKLRKLYETSVNSTADISSARCRYISLLWYLLESNEWQKNLALALIVWPHYLAIWLLSMVSLSLLSLYFDHCLFHFWFHISKHSECISTIWKQMTATASVSTLSVGTENISRTKILAFSFPACVQARVWFYHYTPEVESNRFCEKTITIRYNSQTVIHLIEAIFSYHWRNCLESRTRHNKILISSFKLPYFNHHLPLTLLKFLKINH